MPVFAYQARAPDGERVRGTIVAETARDALEEIERRGLRGYRLAKKALPIYFRFAPEELPRGDLILLTRHLEALSSAGVPIAHGLEALGREQRRERLGRIGRKLALAIARGKTLSQAMGGFPRVFRPYYVGAVEAGERSGRLPEVLRMLADYLEREDELFEETRTAARYPLFVLLYCSLAGIALFGFALPAVGSLYPMLGRPLPEFTAALLGAREFVLTFWPAFLWGAAIAAALIALAASAPRAGAFLGALLLKLPFFRRYLGRPETARLARLLALLAAAGIPLPEAIDLIGRSLQNPALRAETARIARGIRSGRRLSDLLLSSRLLPASLAEAAAAADVGERLAVGVGSLSKRLDEKIRHDFRRFGKTIGPVLVGLLAFAILGLYLSVILPMMELVGSIPALMGGLPSR